MKNLARIALVLSIVAVTACKEEKKEVPPLDDPCALFCERVIECCTIAGLSSCGDVHTMCLSECEAMRTDNVNSGIDFDLIAECVNESAQCYQLLGVDDAQLAETYTACLGEVTGCEYVGTCPTEGATRCCEGGAIATCTFGEWNILPCESSCLEDGQVWLDICNDESGVEACYCGPPPMACEMYCNKGTDYCEERDWQGCAEEGVESCIMLQPDCLAECGIWVGDLEASDIDADAVVRCLWRHASPLQVLGCQPANWRRTYTDCMAEVTGCPMVGACTENGATYCCTGSLSTCTAGYWVIDPCETMCRHDTPETPVWTGECRSEAGVDMCVCEASG
jgi:hypothetical protein